MEKLPVLNFFFHAEDGIRDIGVTGVQTCALPISHLARDGRMLVDIHLNQLHLALCGADRLFEHGPELLAGPAPLGPEVDRSEERRVGKECRTWPLAEP